MKMLRLFLPGGFEDAQLYMGHLVAFTRERDIRLVELERLTSRLETKYPDWRGLLTLAFARNDWLNGSVVTALARNEHFAAALNSAVAEAADSGLPLDSADVDFVSLDCVTPSASVVLDAVFYARRLYLATTTGLFDYDIDWQALRVQRERQRHDARCVSATAEYGAVNASCEDEGLFTGFDEFGWRAHTTNGGLELRQTAPRSMRASFFGTDLINYETAAAPELLRASVEKVTPAEDDLGRDRKVVTDFEVPSDELNDIIDDLQVQRGVERRDLQFVWNSSRAFFINTYAHGFFTAVKTTTTQSGNRFTRHGAATGRVVAVHPFSRGWIIETDFRAYIMSGGKLVELLDEEPLSVRTFAGSKRYRHLIAVTVESGIHLISAIDSF